MVAVTDATHIPNSIDIVVDDGPYPIFFKVEKVLNDEFANADDLDGDGSDQGKHNMDDDAEMEDREVKRSKNSKNNDRSNNSLNEGRDGQNKDGNMQDME